MVSNQSDIGGGILSTANVDAVNRRVATLLGGFDVVHYCPHAPHDNCRCRKPQPGLVLAAATQLGLAPDQCVVVGDIGADIEAARWAGAQSILVPTRAPRRRRFAPRLWPLRPSLRQSQSCSPRAGGPTLPPTSNPLDDGDGRYQDPGDHKGGGLAHDGPGANRRQPNSAVTLTAAPAAPTRATQKRPGTAAAITAHAQVKRWAGRRPPPSQLHGAASTTDMGHLTSWVADGSHLLPSRIGLNHDDGRGPHRVRSAATRTLLVQ